MPKESHRGYKNHIFGKDTPKVKTKLSLPHRNLLHCMLAWVWFHQYHNIHPLLSECSVQPHQCESKVVMFQLFRFWFNKIYQLFLSHTLPVLCSDSPPIFIRRINSFKASFLGKSLQFSPVIIANSLRPKQTGKLWKLNIPGLEFWSIDHHDGKWHPV